MSKEHFWFCFIHKILQHFFFLLQSWDCKRMLACNWYWCHRWLPHLRLDLLQSPKHMTISIIFSNFIQLFSASASYRISSHTIDHRREFAWVSNQKSTIVFVMISWIISNEATSHRKILNFCEDKIPICMWSIISELHREDIQIFENHIAYHFIIIQWDLCVWYKSYFIKILWWSKQKISSSYWDGLQVNFTIARQSQPVQRHEVKSRLNLIKCIFSVPLHGKAPTVQY